MKKKVILIIRDGWGYSKHIKGNAVRNAKIPNNDFYEKHYPWTILKCSGNAVGLPEGTQGGSEPGHLTIGAGRVVLQPYELINKHIGDGTFYKNKAFLKAIKNCKKHNSHLHLMGLFSDQGVHGTTEHLYHLLKLAKKHNLKDVFVHCFLDGRDVPEKSADVFILDFLHRSKQIGVGKIGSMVGRYYAMDRDNNWDRTKMAYKLLVEGVGFKEKDPIKALKHAYKRGEESKNEGRAGDTTDYYVRPIIIVNDDYHHFSEIKDNDSVIFWNFRSDRTRQLTAALTQKKFDKIHRGHRPKTFFVCMSEYDKNFKLPVAFPQQKVSNNLGEVIAKHNLKQLRIAETEKYAHVTFFLNSQIEKPNNGEDRLMVHSPKVPSYDLKPEMNAFGITEKLLPEIEKNKYGLIVVNFANGDLVGHSGNLKAGIKACEAVDNCVGKIVDSGLKKGYVSLITGDHGNVEIMFYPNGEVCPAHGTNPVPFFVISKDKKLQKTKLRKGNGLSDVAPTILDIMGIKKPKEMTGKSLIL
ncbi:2,3-bisphosphoglycerate-independent phosphoglycerate mutase [Candidatus Woesearchaeota archaeon]|nr:2,3-bisphosphoglycerate-independent phosphoglycerate mutase [Candidatus Woesearchaeota archaeon]